MPGNTIQEKDFVRLVSQHERLIYKVCNMYGTEEEVRKDLFQEIVLQAWTAYPRFQGEAAFSTWLYRIAFNTAATYQRKSSRNRTTSYSELPDVHYEALNMAEEEQYRLMYRMISELPAMEKALVMLFMDDYSYRQIAEILGISESNVGTRLARIKEKLKKQAINHQQ
jgi:RNA polymerase sigma factor (sigma-70 family)